MLSTLFVRGQERQWSIRKQKKGNETLAAKANVAIGRLGGLDNWLQLLFKSLLYWYIYYIGHTWEDNQKLKL